ncbi:MAG: trigger factor [Alphaproteobacteria bacterium]|nr:trigger factor [Alphaproteobacteria bacterium]
MNVTETISEGLKREFKVTISADDIDTKVTERLSELAPTLKLPGFRPGKVPTALVKKRFGQSVLGEVLEKSVNDSSQRALDDRGLRPAIQPSIEVTSFEEGKDLEFSLTVELMPEIEPIDFSTISLEKLVAVPGDKQIDEALDKLSEQHKSSEPISTKRASRLGDIVVIDFKGSVDGEAFDGGSAEGHQLELGSNQFIPGFEDQLIGKKAGSTLKVKVTFPDPYSQPALAGKGAVFETKVVEIREPVSVEINDDFAKLFGLDNLAALKDALRGQLEQELNQASRGQLKRTLLDLLEDGKTFEVPKGMADREYESICRAINPPSTDQDQDQDQDQAAIDETLSEEDKQEYRKIAERRVRLGLLLQEVGRLNNIEVTEEEIKRALFQEVSRYPGQEQQIMELYQKNPEAMASIRAPLFEDKIVDFITEMATVTEKSISPEDLMAGPEEIVNSKPKKGTEKASKKKTAKTKTKAKKVEPQKNKEE